MCETERIDRTEKKNGRRNLSRFFYNNLSLYLLRQVALTKSIKLINGGYNRLRK